MSAVWDRTSEFLSDNVAAVAAIAALALYVPNVLNDVLAPLSATAGPGAKLGLGLVALVVSLLGLLGQAALTALVLDPAAGSAGAFSRGAARFPAMVGVSIVVLIGLVALCLPFLGALVVDGVDLTAVAGGAKPDIGPGAALFSVVYLLVLIPLICWLGARLAVTGTTVVAERRGIGAIGRSFALTRGLAARIFGALFLFLIVGVVAGLAAELVFGSIFRLVLGGTGPITAASVLTALIVGLVSTATTVVLTAFVARLYIALSGRADAAPATA